MRLYLLPVSTRRTLLYAQRLNITTTDSKTYLDKATIRAANLWAKWEKKESGWQKRVVDYGNYALRRIPFEEWGLKSVPPLSARKKEEELSGKEVVEVTYPKSSMSESRAKEILKTLATERQALHRKRLIWSLVGMPISAPFALVPIIPNLPFFYLVFRAYSHWKALSGSKHVEFLLEKNLIKAAPSAILDRLYTNSKSDNEGAFEKPLDDPRLAETDGEEEMLLHKSDGKIISDALAIPELEVELDRAVWQVEKALKAEDIKKEEAEKLKEGEEKVKSESKEDR